MTAQLLNGQALSQTIREEIKQQAARLIEQGTRPGLAVIIVGDDPASHVYVNSKHKACLELGFYSEVHRLAEQTSQEELLDLVGRLNGQATIHGILVQLPLPSHIDEKAVIDAIAVEKDVDGFHPVSVGNMVLGDESLLPCTPAGIMEMLKRNDIPIAGKHAVVIGRSNIVGKPISLLLQREHATVTMCHSRTRHIEELSRMADILVVAIGKAHFVNRSFIKPGAVVIDVGMNRLENGKLVGDVDTDDVKELCSWITPVPRGVGPMTITMLMSNTLKSAERFHRLGQGSVQV